jgi:hypothetical protein
VALDPSPASARTTVHPRLTRQEALRLLELDASPGARLDRDTAKRAYRALARTHHPDRGGDAATFHRLRLAYERLVDDGADPVLVVARGRPSRPTAATTPVGEPADLDSVTWGRPLPDVRARLDRDAAAVWLAQPHAAPVVPLLATSRAPGSRWNGVAAHLSPDLTARLRIVPARDDRHREVVAIEVTAGTRRARRALDRVALEGGWVRKRTSSSTTLRTTLLPQADRRATAVQVTDRLERLLERLDWPLPAWSLTTAAPRA